MRVMFSQTRVVQDQFAGTARETRFEAGKVYDLPEPAARHWISRGVAEVVRVSASPKQVDAPPEVQQRAPPKRDQTRRQRQPRRMT